MEAAISAVKPNHTEEVRTSIKKEEAPIFLKTKDLGSKDFLTLLTVQLANQDPWNPVENTEFIAQMASFTSLANSSEQLNIGKDEVELLKGIKTSVDHLGEFMRSRYEGRTETETVKNLM